jgi:hypothetical protein
MFLSNGYTYRRSITVAHVKVPNTDQANFPVLVAGTYAYLAHTTHSGTVTDLNGYDIAFYADPAGTTPLYWEIESYNHATGAVVFWVRVSLATAEDTVFYVFYGNASVSTFQSTASSVWDANFRAVHHLAGSLDLANSVAGGAQLSATGAGVTSDAGMIGNAASYDGSDSFLSPTDHYSFLNLASALTISAWVKIGSSGNRTIFSKLANYNTDLLLAAEATTLFGQVNVGADGSGFVTVADLVGNWKHVGMVYDGSLSGNANRLKIYVNGVPQTLDFGAYSVPAATGNMGSNLDHWGGYNHTGYRMAGLLDELRISDLARAADWIATEVNNQSDPSTFYGVGDEVRGTQIPVFMSHYRRMHAWAG